MKKTAAVWAAWILLHVSCAKVLADSEPAPPVRITVVGTGDFHGALEAQQVKVLDRRDVGGIDIIAAYIQALRRADPEGMVLLDAGDLYQGTLLSAATEGKAVIEFYNELGYDAAVVGNHDFDFGPVGYHSTPQGPDDDPLGVIKARIADARFPFLGANIFDRSRGKPVEWDNLQPFTVLERRGVKIGVIGVSAVDTPLITHPANVRGLEFRPVLGEVRRWLSTVRAKGATVIIVLMHDGVIQDEDSGEVHGAAADFARALRPGEVDLLVAGHTHRAFAGRINDIPVIQSLPKGVAFARADLLVDKASGKVLHDHVVLHENTFFFRTDRNGRCPTYAGRIIKPEPQFVKKLGEFKRSIAHLENIRLGHAVQTLKNQRDRDSPVGNLVCDAIRASDESIDVAMYNSGGLRASIPKGTITFGRIYEVVPFDNSLVTLMLTGAQIRKVLEQGLAGPYGVMEISGLKVRFDPHGVPGRRCVSIVDAAGRELEDDKLYKVATNEFVLNGGDGYDVFARGTNVHNTHTLIREVVARYIKEKGSVGPVQEGRYEPGRRTSEERTP